MDGTFDAFEAAGWESQAAGYDAFFRRITSRLIDPLLDAAGVGAGDRVLDVAAGLGGATARAARRGAAAVGVDRAQAMLALARERHPELAFRRAAATALPFPGAWFDAIVANFLILHLERPEQAASEFARVLAPGGRLALTTWDVPSEARFLGVFLDAVAAAGATASAGIPTGPDAFRFSDEKAFAGLLRGAGLDDVRVQTLTFSHPLASAEQLWDGVLGGTVRTAALILCQTRSTRQRIRAEFDRLVDTYRTADGLAVPVSVKLAAGRKPHD